MKQLWLNTLRREKERDTEGGLGRMAAAAGRRSVEQRSKQLSNQTVEARTLRKHCQCSRKTRKTICYFSIVFSPYRPCSAHYSCLQVTCSSMSCSSWLTQSHAAGFLVVPRLLLADTATFLLLGIPRANCIRVQ